MPILLNSLTNQELLQELQRRIQTGSIAWEINSQIRPDSWMTKLFNFKVSKVEPEVKSSSSPSPGLLNNTTLIWLILIVLLILIVWKKSFTIQSQANLVDKGPNPKTYPDPCGFTFTKDIACP